MNESRRPIAIAFSVLGVVLALGWIGSWQLYKHHHHHWMALVIVVARREPGLRREMAVASATFAALPTLGRLIGWGATHPSAPGFLYHHNRGIQTVSGFLALGLLVVAIAVVAYRWIVRSPMVQAGPHLFVAIVLGCLIALFTGPAASRSYPFQDGAGQFFQRMWLFFAAGILGVIFGYIAAVAMGRDYRSRGLQALATKARTPVKQQPRGGKAKARR
jgi:hypothetical protein